jgi:tripartite-type tricarboxylate transporter receptor subunit TctC
MTHVPYRNSPQAIGDVAAGHIPLTFAEASASQGLIRDGALRALAVTSLTRLPNLPDVPSLAEAVQRPGFEAVSWHMLIAPAATPRPIVERLHAEMRQIMADPEMRKRIAGHGLLAIEPPTVAESRNYIAAELEKWGRIVNSLGLAGTL